MKTALGVVACSLSLFATTLIACSGGGAGSIDSLDAGGNGSRDGGGDANASGCPAKLPSSGASCALPASTVCNFGCASGGPGSSLCQSGRWTVQLSEQACPPTEPFACGKTTCTAAQYCVTPCCGGPAPACNPIPDAGVCPAGTTPSTCNGGLPGCVDGPCTPPAPYCVDSPSPPPSGCTLEAGKRSFRCLCA
ncbi:MAG: hypothetical protein IPG50_03045 [Myxococcales bacterium]|nr:hypothetical protein [Myxococcales bacterium]